MRPYRHEFHVVSHVNRVHFRAGMNSYSWVPNTRGVLVKGVGGNPSKKPINGGVRNSQKTGFTLPTGDKCNNYSKQLQISKTKNMYHFYTFDKKNSFFNCF